MNSRDPLSRVWRLAQVTPAFVVGEWVYTWYAWDGPNALTGRIGPLTTLLKAGSPTVSEAPGVRTMQRNFSSQAFHFALTDLLPYLRLLAGERHHHVPEDPSMSAGLARLAAGEAELRQQNHEPVRGRSPTVSLVFAPCAVLGETCVPLEPIAKNSLAAAKGLTVTIDGQKWRISLERAVPLGVFAERIRASMGGCRSFTRSAKSRAAARIRLTIRQLMDNCNAQNRGPYWLLFDGAGYQLQANDDGRLLLVRGPLGSLGPPAFDANAPRYMALPIVGVSREQWLANRPVGLFENDHFWSVSSVKQPAPCMGVRAQYRYLRSAKLSDAEAVLFWLDAAVDLACGRSERHIRFRAGRLGYPSAHTSLRAWLRAQRAIRSVFDR